MLHIPLGYAQVTVIWSLADDPEKMTVDYGVALGDGQDAEDVLSAHDDNWSTWQAQWGSAYTLVGMSCHANGDGGATDAEITLNVNSGASAANVPQNTALLVKKVTGVPGRANRGRFYFPPGRLAEVDINNVGMIDAADFAIIQGELDTLYSGMLNNTGDPDALVVLHTDPAAIPTVITGFALQQQVATQRRRLRH